MKRCYLEAFNEVCIIAASYHMHMFSKYNLSLWVKYYVGYSYVALLGLMTIVNIGFVAIRNMTFCIKKTKKSRDKLKYDKVVAGHKALRAVKRKEVRDKKKAVNDAFVKQVEQRTAK